MRKIFKAGITALSTVFAFMAVVSPVMAQDFGRASEADAGAAIAASAGVGLVGFLVYCCFFILFLGIHAYTTYMIYQDAQKKGIDSSVIWAVFYFFLSAIALPLYFYFNKDWDRNAAEKVVDEVTDSNSK